MASWPKVRRRHASVAALVVFMSSVVPVATHAKDHARDGRDAVPLQNEAYAADVADAARRFDLPPDLIRAVIAAESGGGANAVSPKGALGLMQLMPETYGEMQRVLGLGADPFDVRNNIMAGSAYLRVMLDRFGNNGFLAAYHAGPRRFERHLMDGVPLPQDTLEYLARLEPVAENFQIEPRTDRSVTVLSWISAPLFVALSSERNRDTTSTATSPFYLKAETLARNDNGSVNALFPHRRADQ